MFAVQNVSCIFRLINLKNVQKKNFFIYNNDEINQLFKATRLSDVISLFVPLYKTSSDYVGSYPFCRSISSGYKKHFRVSDKKNRYKCFNCGVGGTRPTSFVSRYSKCSFEQALKFINREVHKNKFELTGVMKARRCIDDSLPF